MEARNSTGYAGYYLAPLKLLFPLLAVYLLEFKKSTIWLLVVGLGCIGIFSYDGTKNSIIILGLLGIFAISLKKGQFQLSLLGLVVAINIIAPIENLFFGTTLLLDYFVRRAFIAPGWISSEYFGFEADGENLKNLTYDMGYTLFNDTLSNTSTNFMMWGWARAGWLGGLMIAFCAGSIISVFNYVPVIRFPKLGALMAAGAVLIWAEQFLHTSLLSSGITILVLTALLFNLSPTGRYMFSKKKEGHVCKNI